MKITIEPLFGVQQMVTPAHPNFENADLACRCPFMHRKRDGYSCQFPGIKCPGLEYDTNEFVLYPEGERDKRITTLEDALRDAVAEAANQLVRLKLCNELGGPAEALWKDNRDKWQTAITGKEKNDENKS